MVIVESNGQGHNTFYFTVVSNCSSPPQTIIPRQQEVTGRDCNRWSSSRILRRRFYCEFTAEWEGGEFVYSSVSGPSFGTVYAGYKQSGCGEASIYYTDHPLSLLRSRLQASRSSHKCTRNANHSVKIPKA